MGVTLNEPEGFCSANSASQAHSRQPRLWHLLVIITLVPTTVTGYQSGSAPYGTTENF
jgi:hypothetical protein